MTQKEKLKEAIRLLEEAHPFLYNGVIYSVEVRQIEYDALKNKVFDFVKKEKPNTKLKRVETYYYMPPMAC